MMVRMGMNKRWNYEKIEIQVFVGFYYSMDMYINLEDFSDIFLILYQI
jgi:hypothetical protein